MAEEQRQANQAQGAYPCFGQTYASEREMLLHFFDEYRWAEDFAAQYIGQWIDVSKRAYVKGGLRTIHQREAFHAKLLEARLRALGGSPQCTVPAKRREMEFAFYPSAEKTDAEKLQRAVGTITDPAQAIKPLTDVIEQIEQIEDDEQSKQMLRTIIDDEDELATIHCLQETCTLLSSTPSV